MKKCDKCMQFEHKILLFYKIEITGRKFQLLQHFRCNFLPTLMKERRKLKTIAKFHKKVLAEDDDDTISSRASKIITSSILSFYIPFVILSF